MQKEQARKAWVRPTIVRKPVSETLGGIGTPTDGQTGETPITS
jgi:hypothetical protein